MDLIETKMGNVSNGLCQDESSDSECVSFLSFSSPSFCCASFFKSAVTLMRKASI